MSKLAQNGHWVRGADMARSPPPLNEERNPVDSSRVQLRKLSAVYTPKCCWGGDCSRVSPLCFLLRRGVRGA